ncbi:MAG TPA: ATP-binding protein [Gammaproteobacteria bacterium]|nr:ATP-binding protein [Gammaproteobacteria bacterium]
MAEEILACRYSVIVDATFLNASYIKKFKTIAKHKRVPFVILEFRASEQTLRQRIINRKRDASDADLAILEKQLKQWQVLSGEEKENVIEINTEKPVDIEILMRAI